MERPNLFLVIGLLAVALPAAAATFGAQPGAPCEPTLLATQVSLFCSPDMPTAQCCEPVVAAVDLGGGVPCLCRVAAEPRLVISGLNATNLLTLYTSCGGLRPVGAHLGAACEDPAPLTAADISAPPPAAPCHKKPTHNASPLPPAGEKPSPPPQEHGEAGHGKVIPTHEATSPLAPVATTPPPPLPRPALSAAVVSAQQKLERAECDRDPELLASTLVAWCGNDGSNTPLPQCCSTVMETFEHGCLCDVTEEPELTESLLDRLSLIYRYTHCGGTRPPRDGECRASSPTPTPPSPDPEESTSGTTATIVGLVVACACLAVFIGYLAYVVWKFVHAGVVQAERTNGSTHAERTDAPAQAERTDAPAQAERTDAPAQADLADPNILGIASIVRSAATEISKMHLSRHGIRI